MPKKNHPCFVPSSNPNFVPSKGCYHICPGLIELEHETFKTFVDGNGNARDNVWDLGAEHLNAFPKADEIHGGCIKAYSSSNPNQMLIMVSADHHSTAMTFHRTDPIVRAHAPFSKIQQSSLKSCGVQKDRVLAEQEVSKDSTFSELGIGNTADNHERVWEKQHYRPIQSFYKQQKAIKSQNSAQQIGDPGDLLDRIGSQQDRCSPPAESGTSSGFNALPEEATNSYQQMTGINTKPVATSRYQNSRFSCITVGYVPQHRDYSNYSIGESPPLPQYISNSAPASNVGLHIPVTLLVLGGMLVFSWVREIFFRDKQDDDTIARMREFNRIRTINEPYFNWGQVNLENLKNQSEPRNGDYLDWTDVNRDWE